MAARVRMRMTTIVVAGAVAISFFAFSSGPASAGKHGAGNAGTTGTATLTCPTSAGVGASFTVSGAGYNPAAAVWFLVTTNEGTTWANKAPSSSGSVSIVWTEWVATPAYFATYAKPDPRTTPMARCSTTVG
ncbi:MAG: hypothetical protein ABR548_04520 [Actinomycetota bacterium]